VVITSLKRESMESPEGGVRSMRARP
jgi:hypothetical protein